jgi:hypothetical protein
MRVVALEEHFAPGWFLEGQGPSIRDWFNVDDQLRDVSDGRIAEMDAAGVEVQVLSLTAPGLEQLPAGEAVPMAQEINDFLADAIRQNPTRLAGFAALPVSDPSAAAEELQRAVDQHDLVGAVINGHCRGRHLDDEFFWPIFERLEGLDVPLYLHPTPPPKPVVDLMYAGNYSESVTEMFATGAWGWHIETATHVIRLILSGVFDRFPQLQLIIGHMGEALPIMLPRLDMALPTTTTGLQHAPSEYLRRNLHYTFSGFNWTSAFLELLFQVGVDRIMFSTDYPYGSMAPATEFLHSIPASPADRERIAHRNADQLLRL